MAAYVNKIGLTRNIIKGVVKGAEKKTVESSPAVAQVLLRSGDSVGPPDPVSHLRPVTFHVPSVETSIEAKFRARRAEVQEWHQNFWTAHNTAFIKEKKEFEASLASPPTADEMSVFYKNFLDKYYARHMDYNIEWYKRNLSLLALAFQVRLFKNLGLE